MSETPKHETEIAVFVEAIRERKVNIERLTKMNEAAREEVEKLLIERGESWKDENGYAMLTADSERISYDTKALDELILAKPEEYGWLHEYRRKSVVAGGLKIK